jgi:diguanylate cyclase (GGDEF)-like protein
VKKDQTSDALLIEALRKRIDELEKENTRLSKLATTDALTGLSSKECIQEKRIHTLRDLSVIMIDLDKFKPINDTYGHAVGDELLIWFGNILRSHVRPRADTVVRWGGDEFIIILHGADKKKAEEIATNIIHDLAQNYFDTDDTSLVVEASFGVASSNGDTFTDFEDLLKKADKEMYKHKKSKGTVR